MAATRRLFRRLNEQGHKFSMITTGISSHVRYLFEKKVSGCSLWVFFWERRPPLKHPCDGLFFFYLSSKRNRKFKHLAQTKPVGENTITNIMKVSVAGTSLNESEKKVYESLCEKNNSQEAEESKLDCKFRTYRQYHRPQRYKFP